MLFISFGLNSIVLAADGLPPIPTRRTRVAQEHQRPLQLPTGRSGLDVKKLQTDCQTLQNQLQQAQSDNAAITKDKERLQEIERTKSETIEGQNRKLESARLKEAELRQVLSQEEQKLLESAKLQERLVAINSVLSNNYTDSQEDVSSLVVLAKSLLAEVGSGVALRVKYDLYDAVAEQAAQAEIERVAVAISAYESAFKK